jgi:hypothetical protein
MPSCTYMQLVHDAAIKSFVILIDFLDVAYYLLDDKMVKKSI